MPDDETEKNINKCVSLLSQMMSSNKEFEKKTIHPTRKSPVQSDKSAKVQKEIKSHHVRCSTPTFLASVSQCSSMDQPLNATDRVKLCAVDTAKDGDAAATPTLHRGHIDLTPEPLHPVDLSRHHLDNCPPALHSLIKNYADFLQSTRAQTAPACLTSDPLVCEPLSLPSHMIGGVGDSSITTLTAATPTAGYQMYSDVSLASSANQDPRSAKSSLPGSHTAARGVHRPASIASSSSSVTISAATGRKKPTRSSGIRCVGGFGVGPSNGRPSTRNSRTAGCQFTRRTTHAAPSSTSATRAPSVQPRYTGNPTGAKAISSRPLNPTATLSRAARSSPSSFKNRRATSSVYGGANAKSTIKSAAKSTNKLKTAMKSTPTVTTNRPPPATLPANLSEQLEYTDLFAQFFEFLKQKNSTDGAVNHMNAISDTHINGMDILESVSDTYTDCSTLCSLDIGATASQAAVPARLPHPSHTAPTSSHVLPENLINLQTEINLATVPLKSENSQLRRQVHMLTEQLKGKITNKSAEEEMTRLRQDALEVRKLLDASEVSLKRSQRELDDACQHKLQLMKLMASKDQDYRNRCSSLQNELSSVQHRLDAKNSEIALLRNKFTMLDQEIMSHSPDIVVIDSNSKSQPDQPEHTKPTLRKPAKTNIDHFMAAGDIVTVDMDKDLSSRDQTISDQTMSDQTTLADESSLGNESSIAEAKRKILSDDTRYSVTDYFVKYDQDAPSSANGVANHEQTFASMMGTTVGDSLPPSGFKGKLPSTLHNRHNPHHHHQPQSMPQGTGQGGAGAAETTSTNASVTPDTIATTTTHPMYTSTTTATTATPSTATAATNTSTSLTAVEALHYTGSRRTAAPTATTTTNTTTDASSIEYTATGTLYSVDGSTTALSDLSLDHRVFESGIARLDDSIAHMKQSLRLVIASSAKTVAS